MVFSYENRLIAIGNTVQVRAQISAQLDYPIGEPVRVYAKVERAANMTLLLHGQADLPEGIFRQFGISMKELKAMARPKNFIGRAPEQVDAFIKEEVTPWLRKQKFVKSKVELKV